MVLRFELIHVAKPGGLFGREKVGAVGFERENLTRGVDVSFVATGGWSSNRPTSPRRLSAAVVADGLHGVHRHAGRIHLPVGENPEAAQHSRVERTLALHRRLIGPHVAFHLQVPLARKAFEKLVLRGRLGKVDRALSPRGRDQVTGGKRIRVSLTTLRFIEVTPAGLGSCRERIGRHARLAARDSSWRTALPESSETAA